MMKLTSSQSTQLAQSRALMRTKTIFLFFRNSLSLSNFVAGENWRNNHGKCSSANISHSKTFEKHIK